ncbi:MAG: diguanylate cyclase domain-containing protein [Schwartzia sp. (in: firmicutes)]
MNIGQIEEILAYYETTYEFCLSFLRIERYQKMISEALETAESAVERAILHYAYAEGCFKNDQVEEAYPHWKKALHYAKGVGLTAYIAKIQSHLAIYWYVHGEIDKSDLCFRWARHSLTHLHLYDALAVHYIDMLYYRRYEPDTEETMYYLQKAVHYAEKADSALLPRVYLHIGYIYKVIFNDFIRGSEFLTLAEESARKYRLWETEAMALHVLADGYLAIGHFMEMRCIYEQIQKSSHYGDITPRLRGRILLNLIFSDLAHGDLDKAEKGIEELEALRDKMANLMRDQVGAVADRLRSQLYILRGIRLEEAERLLVSAESVYLRYGRRFYVERFDYFLYRQFGDLKCAMRDFSAAEEYYLRARKVAPNYELSLQQEIFARLGKMYQGLGKYRQAYEYCRQEDEVAVAMRVEHMAVRYERLVQEFFRSFQERELQKLNEKKAALQRDVNVDALTQVYNKKYYLQYLRGLRQGKRTEVSRLTLLMADIDDFKRYNDTYGHQAGDECLRQVAQTLADAAASYDGKVMRYGGEEFVIALENRGVTEGASVADDVRERLEALRIPHRTARRRDYVTVSIGIAEERRSMAENIDDLIERSDEALYLAKRAGGNQAACDLTVKPQPARA